MTKPSRAKIVKPNPSRNRVVLLRRIMQAHGSGGLSYGTWCGKNSREREKKGSEKALLWYSTCTPYMALQLVMNYERVNDVFVIYY